MAKIQVLSAHLADLIAAGEVVERPASVVKELMENAIDAGATQITVSIVRGGIVSIQVDDNGSGIEQESIATAFLPHATSKLYKQEDLEHIATLGFRGEALASIASVARVQVITKTQQDEFACSYVIEGGIEQSVAPAARAVGTTFIVKDLFYNTPARMKFLKKDQTEGIYVSEVVCRIALSHPEIAVKFLKDGKIQLQTSGDGSLQSACYAVLSREFSKDLSKVDLKTGHYHVTGLVTKPALCRASRAMQFFFINGRFVKNKTILAALEGAYKGTLMQGKFPGGVLMLQLPTELVDVNVHPTKTEVRFAKEKEVFEAVYSAVKSAVSTPQASHQNFSFNGVEKQQTWHNKTKTENQERSNDFKNRQVTFDAIQTYQNVVKDIVSAPMEHRQVASPITTYQQEVQKESIQEPFAHAYLPEKELENEIPYQEEKDTPDVKEEIPVLKKQEPLQVIGEAFQTYLITQRGNDLCFIDKHAAHERIIYEALSDNYGNVSSQLLLAPVSVYLSAKEKQAVLEQAEMLQKSGFEMEDFGGTAVIVRAVPADIEIDDVEGLVQEIAQKLSYNPKEILSEKTQWVLHSIACRAAVKAGDKMHEMQMLKLAQQVLDGEVPPFCPHGRPVILHIQRKELEKQFGRQG